jgi:hypothetical protein
MASAGVSSNVGTAAAVATADAGVSAAVEAAAAAAASVWRCLYLAFIRVAILELVQDSLLDSRGFVGEHLETVGECGSMRSLDGGSRVISDCHFRQQVPNVIGKLV